MTAHPNPEAEKGSRKRLRHSAIILEKLGDGVEDEAAVRDKSHPGHAFIIAGFRVVGRTKRREYLALVLRPDRMPKPQPALGMQHGLELAA